MKLVLTFILGFIIYSGYGQLTIKKYDLIDGTATINKISIDDANYIWVCTQDGIQKIGNISDNPLTLCSGKNITTIDHDRRLGTFASDGIQLFDVNKGAIYTAEEGVIINDLEIFQSRIYLATNQGIVIYNPSTHRAEIMNKDNSKLKSDMVNFIHEDKNGILWFGTASGEIRVDGKKWKNYHEGVNVTDMYENKEGIWFIGDGEMWLVDQFNREYNAGLNAQLYSGTLNDFVIDSKGRLYVASDKMVRYDPYNEDIQEYESDAGLLSKKCTSIACDKNDNVWIGTGGTGLYRLIFGDAAIAEFTVACLLDQSLACSGDQNAKVKVSVSGGQGPYIYEWSNGKLKGNNPTSVGPGIYTVTVTDKIQNRQAASIEIVAPEPISAALVNTDRVSGPGRRDGTLTVLGTGGTGQLSYIWQDGQKGPQARNLGSGSYKVTITDANKCSIVQSFEVPREKFIPELNINTISVGKTLRINELYFKADSTDVTDESFDVLKEVLDFLITNNTVVVEIGGHTNTIPSDAYCDELSTARAQNVASYFYKNGISADRLSFKGYGKRQPITLDESTQGRKKNQRVEIKILAL